MGAAGEEKITPKMCPLRRENDRLGARLANCQVDPPRWTAPRRQVAHADTRTTLPTASQSAGHTIRLPRRVKSSALRHPSRCDDLLGPNWWCGRCGERPWRRLEVSEWSGGPQGEEKGMGVACKKFYDPLTAAEKWCGAGRWRSLGRFLGPSLRRRKRCVRRNCALGPPTRGVPPRRGSSPSPPSPATGRTSTFGMWPLTRR